MTEPSKSEELVEDLDLPAEDGDQVKGGISDGTSNTIMVGEVSAKKGASPSLFQQCAKGEHFPEAKLTS